MVNQIIEKANVCRGRTWQSLKEHFRKQVMPQIGTYHLLPKQVSRFRRAWEDGERVLVLSSDDSDDQDEAEPKSKSPCKTPDKRRYGRVYGKDNEKTPDAASRSTCPR